MKVQKEYNCCQKNISCEECKSFDLCNEWVKFVKEHGDIKKYSHFDKRVSLAMPSIRQYVLSKDKISKHGFYPFIHFSNKKSIYGRKKVKKLRELYYCSHIDRCVYQRYAFLINYHYNKFIIDRNMNEVAIAYRNNLGKNNIDFAKKAFSYIKEHQKCFIFVGDFTNFFDNLKHEYLKKMLCEVLNVDYLEDDYYVILKNISKFSSIDWINIVKLAGKRINERGIRTKLNQKQTILTKQEFKNAKNFINKNLKDFGIPQGSPISAVLSNVYMIQFDKDINEYVLKNNGTYMRYSDDFLIIIPYISKEEIEKHINFVFDYVESMNGLIELQKQKTATYIYENSKIIDYNKEELSKIDYLGFLFDGKDVKIRPKAITKYYYRMRRKAYTIGYRNWKSPLGRHISAKKLYRIYSNGEEKQTFIDYAKRARRILNLNDSELNSLIKNHKHKIRLAIKRGMKES